MKNKIKAIILLIAWLIGLNAFAHSGGTNADGCHTNHSTGDYHCHNARAPGSYENQMSGYAESRSFPFFGLLIVIGFVVVIAARYSLFDEKTSNRKGKSKTNYTSLAKAPPKKVIEKQQSALNVSYYTSKDTNYIYAIFHDVPNPDRDNKHVIYNFTAMETYLIDTDKLKTKFILINEDQLKSSSSQTWSTLQEYKKDLNLAIAQVEHESKSLFERNDE